MLFSCRKKPMTVEEQRRLGIRTQGLWCSREERWTMFGIEKINSSMVPTLLSIKSKKRQDLRSSLELKVQSRCLLRRQHLHRWFKMIKWSRRKYWIMLSNPCFKLRVNQSKGSISKSIKAQISIHNQILGPQLILPWTYHYLQTKNLSLTLTKAPDFFRKIAINSTWICN